MTLPGNLCKFFVTCRLLLLGLLVPPHAATAQEVEAQEVEDQHVQDQEVEKLDQKNERNFEILPVVGPSSSPELGLTLSGAVIMNFKVFPGDTLSPRTSLGVSFSVSTKGAIVVGTRFDSYWMQDRLRVEGDFSFRDLPDHYWGVGFDPADTIPKGDSTTAYQRTAWRMKPIILWRLKGDVFAGINIDLNYTNAHDPNPLMQHELNYLAFGPKNYNGGAGLAIRYDSRDVPVNAYSGAFAQILTGSYSPWLGSNNNYHLVDIDYRGYNQIGRGGRTFAWILRTRITTGSVPYAEVSQIGSSRDLRGYRQGQYRDDTMVFGIVEYRHMLTHFWSGATENKFGEPHSRHGFTVWVGVGTIGEDHDGTLRPLPNFGFGYRFEAIKRTSLRVDFGFGRSGFGFYLDFNEAF